MFACKKTSVTVLTFSIYNKHMSEKLHSSFYSDLKLEKTSVSCELMKRFNFKMYLALHKLHSQQSIKSLHLDSKLS